MKNKSFLSLIIFVSVLVFLWILSGWNTENFDYANYNNRYNYISDNGFNLLRLDFGYDLIEYILIQLGATYQQFRIVVYGIALFIVGLIIYKWSINPVFVLLFYICYHFVRDVVETRNFLGSVFILLTINLFGKKGNAHIWYLILLIFAGFSLHMSFILYFFLLFTERKKLNYWSLLVICGLLALGSRTIFGSISMLNMFEGMDDKINEFMAFSPQYAIFVSLGLAIGNGICVSYFNNSLNHCNSSNKSINHLSVGRYSEIMYNINALSCFLIVFTTINGSFYSRLFGNLLLLNIIYFSNVISLVEKSKFTLIVILVVYITVFLYFTQIPIFWEHLALIVDNNALFSLSWLDYFLFL